MESLSLNVLNFFVVQITIPQFHLHNPSKTNLYDYG